MRCHPFSLLLTLFFALPLLALSQIQQPIHIDDTKNIVDVIKALQGPGIEITNITYSMPEGRKAIGYFEDTGNLLGLKKGLVITSEAANFATGPNNSSGRISAGPIQEMNDADLATVTNGPFYDIATVEFDIKTVYSKFSFSYVFGSEEYPEYVDGIFNDTFGFFISGPGIAGAKNLATLDDGSPISINSINQFLNSEYFISNGTGATPLVNYYLQYDGLTKKLTASTAVIPNESYHIKLIISDIGDNSFDSGVFIEQESFVSEIPYKATISYENDRFDYAIEGCNKAFLTIEREAQNAVDPLILDLSFEGIAINGNDFTFIQPGPLTLAAGVLTAIIEIVPLADALPEGDETVVLHLTNAVTGNFTTSQVTIKDKMDYDIDETTICSTIPTIINNNPEVNFSFNWQHHNGLSCEQCISPTATLTQNALFPVEVTHLPSGCKTNITASVLVNNFQYNFNDELVCYNTSTAINKNASNDYDYRWQQTQGLSCLNCLSPSITVLQDKTLSVEVTEVASGCKTNSELNLDVYKFDFSFEETSVCENMPTTINKNPSPGYAFTWESHSSLSCTNCTSPSVVLSQETSFQVKVKELIHGCEITREVPVKVKKIDYKVPESLICKDEENAINLEASDNYIYRWKADAALSCTNCKSPKVRLEKPTSFPVEIEEITTGCKIENQALVKLKTVNYLVPSILICANQPTTINSNAPAEYLFQWAPNPGLSCLNCSSPFLKTENDVQLNVQIEDRRIGCRTKLTVPAKVIKVNYPILPQEVCENTLTGIHINFQEGYSFEWLPDEDLSCLKCTSPEVVLQNDKSFLLEVRENKSACKTIVTVPIKIKKIQAHFTYTITDNYSSIIADFKNQSNGANEYRWTFGDGNNSLEFEPTFEYNPLGETINIQLTAINNQGLYCEATEDASIFLHEPVFIPNVITPDNDQYNQFFEVKGIEKGVWLLIILNSWGKQVYSSNGYLNDWSAENNSTGFYFYELRNPEDNKSYKGWLHVIK
jgi:hypothetical protein